MNFELEVMSQEQKTEKREPKPAYRSAELKREPFAKVQIKLLS